MLPSVPRLADYGISPENGFLPADLPLEALPDPYYERWETILKNLQGLILSRRLREVVNGLPILATDRLNDEGEWRRAYSVLAFITHAYVWGGDRPLDTVPPPIAIPFTAVCEHLEMPTVASYAGVVLWNFKPLFDDEPIDNLENLTTLATFTGSLDESWFYLVSVAIEARAGPIIPIMLNAIEAARIGDVVTVTAALQSFAERLDDLGSLLTRMYENCDPHVFYHRIRPFLAGSKNMADAGLPHGVLFDTGAENQHYVQLSGGSNAQSSMLQFFDLVLGIDHLPTGSRKPNPSASDSEGAGQPSPSQNFILNMRKYMPGIHRRFLEHVSTVANIREFVEARRHNRVLCTSYDACLAMLGDFRDKHIQMVSRYIIIKSRESRSHERSLSPRQAPQQRINLATKTERDNVSQPRKLRGTGGTALIPFLKQARDETGEPAIGNWARRVLNSGPANGFASLGTMNEHANGVQEIVGLAGIWSVDDSEGGICHW